MTEKERMLAGKLYSAQDKELRHELFKAKELTEDFLIIQLSMILNIGIIL